MEKKCPIEGKIREALEQDKYYDILLGKNEYWIELEKYCERGSYRLWHNRHAVVDAILDWAIWKDDIQEVIGKFSDAIERLVTDDPLVALDTLHAYISITIKDRYQYGPEEEELDVDFGLDCQYLYSLIVKSKEIIDKYKYNDEELGVYFRLLEILPKYLVSRPRVRSDLPS